MRAPSSQPSKLNTKGISFCAQPHSFLAFKTQILRGAWVAQLVKLLTLDFGSGQDLTVRGFEPRIWLCSDSAEPAWNFLFSALLSQK